MAATAIIVSGVVGAAATADSSRRASNTARDSAREGAAAADPARGERPFYMDELRSRWGALSSTNPNDILNNPAYRFRRDQGNQAIINQASAMGLSRSGTLLEDLATFNQGLASTFVDQDFARNMSLLGVLGNFSGLNIGNPGMAGNILSNGGANAALIQQQGINNAMGQVGGALAYYDNYRNRTTPYGGGGTGWADASGGPGYGIETGGG